MIDHSASKLFSNRLSQVIPPFPVQSGAVR